MTKQWLMELEMKPPFSSVILSRLHFDVMDIWWEARVASVQSSERPDPGGCLDRGVVCVNGEGQNLIP